MEPISYQNAELLLNSSERELYLFFLPENIRNQSYSKAGLIQRAKEIFSLKLESVKDTICKIYKKHKDTAKNAVDMVILIATGLSGSPKLDGIEILPFAALIVKIGLEETCKN